MCTPFVDDAYLIHIKLLIYSKADAQARIAPKPQSSYTMEGWATISPQPQSSSVIERPTSSEIASN